MFIIRLDTELACMKRDECLAVLERHGIGYGLYFRVENAKKYYCGMMLALTGILPNTEWCANESAHYHCSLEWAIWMSTA